MIDIVGFNNQGVHILFGNGTGHLEVRNGSTLKFPGEYTIADGYTTANN